MFKYVEDKNYLSRVRCLCGEIMQDFCHLLKENYNIGANFYLVGSGARNLITQNASQPIDLDYNLQIVRCENIHDGRTIKECARKALNQALCAHDLGDCEDSTSSLTTKKFHFKNGNPTEFSMDVCITFSDDNGVYRLKHEKTGNALYDKYNWNMTPNSDKLREKAAYIKDCGKWSLVRTQYLTRKNQYLHPAYLIFGKRPSFFCYIEAVNAVYSALQNR